MTKYIDDSPVEDADFERIRNFMNVDSLESEKEFEETLKKKKLNYALEKFIRSNFLSEVKQKEGVKSIDNTARLRARGVFVKPDQKMIIKEKNGREFFTIRDKRGKYVKSGYVFVNRTREIKALEQRISVQEQRLLKDKERLEKLRGSR